MKTGAIIQARLGSERFPGKVLRPLPVDGGDPVIVHISRRARQAPSVEVVALATSDLDRDDPVAAAFPGEVFRGDEEDVLGRLHHAAQSLGLTTVVRLTGDNPCIDPQKLEETIAHHHKEGADYTLSTGLPLGTNVEVVSMAALETAHQESTDAYDREHVTPFIRRDADRFRLTEIAFDLPDSLAALRLTMDYPSDYAMLNVLFGHFRDGEFSLEDVGGFVEENPWVAEINPNPQRNRFSDMEEERRAALECLRRFGFARAASLLEKATA